MFAGCGQRGGTRGGKDHFTWDDVKGDKYKEFYLGHSVFTSDRRTFNNPNPNPLWWMKGAEGSQPKRPEKNQVKDEIAMIKAEEERMRLEELGLLPKKAHNQVNQLDKEEYSKLIKRGETSRDMYDVGVDDKISGIGFGDEKRHMMQELYEARERNSTGKKEPKDSELEPVGEPHLLPRPLTSTDESIRASADSTSSLQQKSKKDKKKKKKDKKHKKSKKKKKKTEEEDRRK